MAYIRERNGKWSYMVELPPDPVTGKRAQKYKGGFESERAARRSAEALEEEIEKGRKVTNLTVEQFTEQFLDKQVKHQVELSTYMSQKQWARDYIYPTLGNKKLDEIEFEEIEDFYNDLLDDGVSRAVIKNVAMVLRKAFRAAKKRKLILYNVVQDVMPPSYKPRKMKVWNPEEINNHLKKLEPCQDHIIYMVTVFSGMRLGEVLALHWRDVDFKTNRIKVTKSLRQTYPQTLNLKHTKTDNSQRNIMMPQFVMDALLKHKEKQLPDVEIVFDNYSEFLSPSTVSRRFKDSCVRFGVPVIRFHDLRHTHATDLLSKGFNAKVVAERLGDHVQTVLTTYAHVLPSMQKEVANKLDAMYAKAVDNVDNLSSRGQNGENGQTETAESLTGKGI